MENPIITRFRKDPTSVSLAEYLTVFEDLVQELEHWAEIGITTAAQAGDYLDGCVERERQKGNIIG